MSKQAAYLFDSFSIYNDLLCFYIWVCFGDICFWIKHLNKIFYMWIFYMLNHYCQFLYFWLSFIVGLGDFIQPKNCEILNSGGNIFCKIKILYIFIFVNCFVHKKIIGEQEGGRKKFIGCQLFAGDKANTNCLDANTNLFVCTDKYTC